MKQLNRRNFLSLAGTSLIGVTLGGISLRANAQERLKVDNPSAAALQYKHKSEIEGANCSNCNFIQGDAGEEWRPCALFPNQLVNNNGWCAAYSKKA